MEKPQRIVAGTADYRRLAWAMVMAGFSTFSLLYSAQPLLPEFAREFSISAEAASLAVSIATGPMAFGILLAGWVADRIGRRTLMVWSLAGAAGFGILAGFAANWHGVLALRCLCGIALSGVPAVAMSYVSEEVEPAAIGPAIGLYIAGSAIGGMIGRLGVAVLSEWVGWRWGLGAVGIFSAAAAIIFWACAPQPREFRAKRHTLSSFLSNYGKVLRDPVLLLLYLEGLLLMGAFVTIYNYAPFLLTDEPYRLSHAAIGAIFLLYIVGSFSSAIFGAWSGRYGVRTMFWIPVAIMVTGILATSAPSIWSIIAAMAITTTGFFGAHTIASSWVSRRAFDERGYASALYLFCYYAGSSLLGTAGGVMWSQAKWPGIVSYTGLLCLTALIVAFIITRFPPRADPRQPAMGQPLPG